MTTNMTTATILIISSKRVLDHDLPRILMKRYSEDDNFDDHFDDEFVISHLLQCCLMMVMIMTRIMTTTTIKLIMNLESHIFSNVDKFLGLEDIHRESFHNSVHFVQLLVHLIFCGEVIVWTLKKNTNVLTVYMCQIATLLSIKILKNMDVNINIEQKYKS